MSQLEVDKIIPQSGTTLTIGDSGDTVNFADGTNLSIDTNTLYIDSTNNRVGIANASPSVALDVTGAAKVSGDLTVDNTTGAELILSRNDTSIAVDDLIGGIQFKANDASSSPDPQICGIKAISTGATNTNPKLSFFAGESNYNANTPNMSIDSGGNITMSSDLTVDTNTLFVDSSENTVVIGGTDATSWNANADELVVAGASAGGMTFYNPTQTNIFFADGTTGDDVSRGRIQYVHSGNSLIFGTDATERARIDGSGDLLIGKTSISTNAVGVALTGTGLGAFTRSSQAPIIANRTTSDGDAILIRKDNSTVGVIGTQNWGIGTSSPSKTLDVAGDAIITKNDTPLYLNRTGSDGEILRLSKDGTPVGSIGVSSTKMYIGTGNANFRFRDDLTAIIPANSDGSNSDNDLDLGYSTVRWRRLYLSEGVFLGGTGTANKLEDYEEGTWTPIVNSANGFSTGATNYTGTAAPRYTKIGNRVFLQAQVQMANSSGNVALDDNITMTGLPFTPADIERNTVTEYRYNSNVAYMTSYLTGAGAIFSAVRFLKGTPQRGGGSLNININYTV